MADKPAVQLWLRGPLARGRAVLASLAAAPSYSWGTAALVSVRCGGVALRVASVDAGSGSESRMETVVLVQRFADSRPELLCASRDGRTEMGYVLCAAITLCAHLRAVAGRNGAGDRPKP